MSKQKKYDDAAREEIILDLNARVEKLEAAQAEKQPAEPAKPQE